MVCEGGPRWLHDLVAAGVVDEADITVAPLFAGNATTPRTPALEAVTQMRLTQVLTGDGTAAEPAQHKRRARASLAMPYFSFGQSLRPRS